MTDWTDNYGGESMARILVTGGTGFVGAHCLIQLLAAGHETRTTVRDLAREKRCARHVARGGLATRATA